MTSRELVDCSGLPRGTVVEVETRTRKYQIECLGGAAVRVSGHPEYCPTPVLGHLQGLIERGKHLRFILADRPVTTSRMIKVRLPRGTPSRITRPSGKTRTSRSSKSSPRKSNDWRKE
jgi:hypothetical protein